MNRLPMLIEGLGPEALVALVDDVLADRDHETRVELLRDPVLLGAVCEATLAELDPVEMLEEHLMLEDLPTLRALIGGAILARLPAL